MPINKELDFFKLPLLPDNLKDQARALTVVNTSSGPVPFQAIVSGLGGAETSAPDTSVTADQLTGPSATLTDLVIYSSPSGNLFSALVSQLVALVLANDGSTDLSAAPAVTALSDVGFVFGVKTDGSLIKVPGSLLGTASSGTSAVAPGQVGSLAAGTPTSTTIPLTWTAPTTGTTPFTYTVQVAAHGSSSYSAASGSFSSTGGTVTGLIASTNYDFKVIVSNGTAPNSTTSLTTGITTAASSGGGTTPALVMTNPVYGARGDGSGKQMLKAGSGSVSITLPTNKKWFVRIGAIGTTTYNYSNNAFILFSDGTHAVGAAFNNRGITGLDDAGVAGDPPQPPVLTDGGPHLVAIDALSGGGTNVYLDGSAQANRSSGIAVGGAVTMTVYGDSNSTLVAGVFDIRVYDGSFATPGNLLYEWLLDGNGNGV